jgi:hypothetical protein
MTRARVRGATLAPGVKVRDTAERETPASAATSWEVTFDCCFTLGSGPGRRRRAAF